MSDIGNIGDRPDIGKVGDRPELGKQKRPQVEICDTYYLEKDDVKTVSADFSKLTPNASLKLPAGKYVVMAKALLTNVSAEKIAMLKRNEKIVMGVLVKKRGLPVHYISEREPRFKRSEVLTWLDSLPTQPTKKAV